MSPTEEFSSPGALPHSGGSQSESDATKVNVGSIKELISLVTGRYPTENQIDEEFGAAEPLPFPFLGMVGQKEMKLALILALINPAIGGVLLIGPRGYRKNHSSPESFGSSSPNRAQ